MDECRTARSKLPKFVTVGVYGFTKDEFFAALEDANVDTFCDIRARRGMRGRTYSFVNSTVLQSSLASRGIRYLHIKDLAPTPEVRDTQKRADLSSGIGKRQRTELGEAFVKAYLATVLRTFNWQSMLDRLPIDAEVVALFCVERSHRACHRSLVADRLVEVLDAVVEHVT